MSYRDDLNAWRQQHEKRTKYKNTVVKSAKITVMALAVAFLCTLVFLIVDFATDSPSGMGGSGGGGGGVSGPTITLKSGDAIYMYVGENISFRELVDINDASGNAELADVIKPEGFSFDKTGTYQLIFVAKSPSGATARLPVTLVITEKKYTPAMLEEKIAGLCNELNISKQMSTREQLKAVFNFVHDKKNISFEDYSNTPGIDRRNWKTDYIQEAIRTLEAGSGDCYSYYSVSRAFFDYLGINYDSIERENTAEHDGYGTHFWLAVEVSDAWYYYDATRLKYTFGNENVKQYMMTYEDTQSYDPKNELSYNFYAFNPKNYKPYKTN